MKLKNFLMPVMISGSVMTLISCNGGHQSLPATNYGEVVSITQQDYNGNKTFHIFEKNGESDSLFDKTLEIGSFADKNKIDTYAYADANIKNLREDFNVDLMGFNAVSTSESIEAYAIKYNTPGQNHDTDPAQIKRTVSGLIVLPKAEKIRGVVLYFHPTEFGKSLVPSCNYKSTTTPDYCNITADKGDNKGFNTFAYLASVYASRGFAVVAPDYLGMGADWDNVHPYVIYPEVNALSGFYMFPALRQLLNEKNISAKDKLPLMLTGFSEGGGYALKASELAQGKYKNLLSDNNLELKITSPQEGAYSLQDQMGFAFADLSDGVFNCANKSHDSNFVCGESNAANVDFLKDDVGVEGAYITDDVNHINSWRIITSIAATSAKPSLSGYMLASSIYYNFNNLTTIYGFAMNNDFWSQIKIGGLTTNLYDLFSGNAIKYTDKNISSALLNSANNILDFSGNNYNLRESYSLMMYMGSKLANLKSIVGSENPLKLEESIDYGYGKNNQGILFINQGVQNTSEFKDLLLMGSTYNWKTKLPINFIRMNYDSAVAVLNSYQAYACMKNGISFKGFDGMMSSQAICDTSSQSFNMVESTVIENSQFINDISLSIPQFAKNYGTKYWSEFKFAGLRLPEQAKQFFGMPMEHHQMFVLSNIVAMCTFENMLKDGKNSGKCPDLKK